MSPAAKKRAKKGSWEVKGTQSSQKVVITTQGERIRVAWFCGGSRSFTPAELREQIDLLNGPGVKHLPIWLDFDDSEGQAYVTRLNKVGQLTANDPRTTKDNGFVKWEELQGALEEAIAELRP